VFRVFFQQQREEKRMAKIEAGRDTTAIGKLEDGRTNRYAGDDRPCAAMPPETEAKTYLQAGPWIPCGPWGMAQILSDLRDIRHSVLRSMEPEAAPFHFRTALSRLAALIETGIAHVARVEGMDIREHNPSPDMVARVLAEASIDELGRAMLRKAAASDRLVHEAVANVVRPKAPAKRKKAVPVKKGRRK
jgi:hypothetical protein